MSATPVSVLQRAKELVAVGWVGRQPKILNLNNEVCVQTALNQALAPPANNTLAAAKARRTTFLTCQAALLATMGHDHQNQTLGAIPLHNDTCLTSAGDALDWLDRAITHVKEVDA
jgi:hypothetical protein